MKKPKMCWILKKEVSLLSESDRISLQQIGLTQRGLSDGYSLYAESNDCDVRCRSRGGHIRTVQRLYFAMGVRRIHHDAREIFKSVGRSFIHFARINSSIDSMKRKIICDRFMNSSLNALSLSPIVRYGGVFQHDTIWTTASMH